MDDSILSQHDSYITIDTQRVSIFNTQIITKSKTIAVDDFTSFNDFFISGNIDILYVQ